MSNMTAGQELEYTGSLNRSDWDLDTLHVIAFAQEDATKIIKQAGLTVMTTQAPASIFIDSNNSLRPTLGGDRP